MDWKAFALAGALWSGVPEPPPPIVVRHDADEEAVLRFGRENGTGAVEVVLARRSAPQEVVPVAMGTLVADRWVLTAAHVAAAISPGHRMSPLKEYGRNVRVNGRDLQVRRVVLHPDWQGGPGAHDIGLVELAEPVTGVAPVPLYEERDERDQLVTLVGTGGSGTGLTGPSERDGRLRGATNRIDYAHEHYLAFTFDAPDSRRVTPYEGVSGPGDSGGPAFIDRGGVRYIAGVSSGQLSNGPEAEGRYGVEEHYTRVSTYAPWIRTVMTGRVKDRPGRG